MKSYLTACGDMALAADHLIIALDSGSKITIDAVRELQKDVNRYTLSLTELSAEFELIGLAPLEELTAVTAAFERADNLSPQAIQAVVQKVRPLLVAIDRGCRTSTNAYSSFSSAQSGIEMSKQKTPTLPLDQY
jgi:hypothetical protein